MRDHSALGLRQRTGGAAVEIRSRQQAHALQEGNAFPRRPLCLLPVVQHGLELLAIHLHPVAFQAHQTIVGGQHLLPLVRREDFAVEREFDLEIHHGIESQAGALVADADAQLRARRLARLPPVGNAHHHPAGFEGRDVLQKPVRVARAPGQRLKDRAGIDQGLEPGTFLGGFLYRQQQVEQGVALARAGEFLQRAAQGPVLHGGLLRHA